MLDTAPRGEIALEGLAERPVLSINRDFSAPIVIETDRTARRSRLPLGAATTIRSPATRRCSN